MGSRIMHLIIANQIAEKLSIQDKTSFLLGGVAPDAVTPKEISHFYTGDVSDYTRSIDYEAFLNKYCTVNQTNYILGYYSHLISDDLWLKGFYLPWLKNRLNKDSNVFNSYHNDSYLLNGKLLNYYGLTAEIISDGDKNGLIAYLQEVKVRDIKAFLPYVLLDMNYKKEVLEQDLEVFTFQQIVGYVETSVEKAVLHLRSNKVVMN